MNQSGSNAYISFLQSLPNVCERPEKTQLVYSVFGTSFCWITLMSDRIQIFPSLGKKENRSRVIMRKGSEAMCVNRRSGGTEAKYYDPKKALRSSWSYPGFRADSVELDYGVSLIRQAYDQARSYRRGDNKLQKSPTDSGQQYVGIRSAGLSIASSPIRSDDQISLAEGPRVKNSERVRAIFRDLEDIIDSIKPKVGKEDLASRIAKLAEQKRIPNEIASLMHSIRIKRNEIEHDRYEPSSSVLAGIEAYWREIQEWWERNE